jgi:branched-chain amino acid transport system permease protein
VAVVISISLTRSRFGFALRAIRNDEQAAAMVGINLLPTKIAVMTVTAGFAGLAGAVQTWQIGYLDPTTAFGLEAGLIPVAMVLLGGSGLLLGPLVGVVGLGTLHQLLLVKLTVLQTTVYGLVILLVGRFMPRGLVSAFSPPDRVRGETQPRASTSIAHLGLPKADVHRICPVLECRDLTMAFGGLRAVDSLSLKIGSGEIVGLVGPNGSGKTTLFNCVSKVYEPTGGTIFLNGGNIASLGPHGISRRGLGRTYQIPRPFSDLTVEENVLIPLLFRSERISHARARREARDLAAFAGLSNSLSSRADTLSLQEKKALEFARALACKPSLLLVDEVASGLSPTEVRNFVKLLGDIRNEFGTTIIWVEHIFWALAEIVDRLVVMENGAIIADGPLQTLVRDENVLRAYLGAQEVALAS